MGFRELSTRLHAKEDRWLPKAVLRLILSVLVLVDICLSAYVLSQAYAKFGGAFGYVFNDIWFGGAAYFFIPLGLSLIWALVYFGILVGAKDRLHPGWAVGFDLVLWLMFVILGILFVLMNAWNTTQFTVAGLLQTNYYSGYDIDGSQGSPNSTSAWYNDEPYMYTSNNGTNMLRVPGSANYQCPYFDSCAEEQTLIDAIHPVWDVYLSAQSILLVCAALHFILWVWACVDCARYNRSRGSTADYGRARLIAEEMVKDMRERGEIMVIQQPAFMASPPGEHNAVNTTYPLLAEDTTALPQMNFQEKGKGPAGGPSSFYA